MKKLFYIGVLLVFVSALFYGANDAKSDTQVQPYADRLFKPDGDKDIQINTDEDEAPDETIRIGKTPLELQDIVINSPVYSSYWGSSDSIGFGSTPMLTCVYNWFDASVNTDYLSLNSIDDKGENLTKDDISEAGDAANEYVSEGVPIGVTISAPLVVNNFMTSGKSREILFGVSDLKYCPLPGSSIFNDYNRAVSGEFLLSGAICVINSILFDAMFKVYCTIIIWFYSLMYAMIIIYIMFYGMALMLGISQDPIKEAPKKILKIVLIFILVTNAQVGFRYVHTFFITVLNSFSSMLADMQTVTDSLGNDAYQSRLSEFYGVFKSLGVSGSDSTSPDNTVEDLFIKKGKLLNINGDVWRPLENGEVLNALNNAGAGGFNVPLASGYQASDEVSADNYVPFRVPNQQWQYSSKKIAGFIQYRLEPVFKSLDVPTPYSDQLKICALDFKYAPNNAEDQPWNSTIQPYLRCPKDNQASMPHFLPYGVYCLYDPRVIDANPDKFEVGNPDSEGKSNPVIICAPSSNGANTQLIRLKNEIGNTTEECNEFANFFASLTQKTAASNLFKPCRSGFQGVFTKADALISGMIGGDRSKGIGGLLAAFAAWSIGGGLLLSLFMMTGFFAITFVAIQVVWTFVTAVMALSFLLMLSPIFISFLLFKTTEKLFRGWLNSLISYTLQPILILAFVFFISAITSVDKINYLMNEELISKTMVVGGAQEGDRKLMSIPKTTGFIEPLYEKPSDFDTFYYDTGMASGSSAFINGKQRDRYLERKGRNILETFFNQHPKFCNGETNNCSDIIAAKPEASAIFGKIMNLHDNGVYPIPLPNGLNPNNDPQMQPLLKSNFRGFKALDEYFEISKYSAGVGQSTPPFGVSNSHSTEWNNNYGTQIIGEILTLYRSGACFNNCNTGSGTSFSSCLQTCDSSSGSYFEGLAPKDYINLIYLKRISIDDGDSFEGEPISLKSEYLSQFGAWNTPQQGPEFPVCKRFCPQFSPKYEPLNTQKPWLANPDINITPGTPNPDGSQCPSNEECYGWKCEKYCMYIKNAKQVLYRDVLSAILAFIIINMVAAAFLSKMPELASALSNWAPGQHPVRIGGGSKIMGQGGGDAWTKSEMSDVYSVGGILSIDPQRPGTILGLLNKATGMSGLYDQVNPDGSITRSKAGFLDVMNSGGLLGGGTRNAQKSQRDADILSSFKQALGLSKQETMSAKDATFKISDLEKLNPFSRDKSAYSEITNRLVEFQRLRPELSTGLKHSEIWEIIQKHLSDGADPATIKLAIMDEIQQKLQTKAEQLSREFKKYCNNIKKIKKQL